MGTMAAFYSRHPASGGELIGTLGMDGHPDRMIRLARARSYTGFRAAVRAVRNSAAEAWWSPRRVWWTWPSAGRIVHDYSYWWDEERGTAMVSAFQFGPSEFDPGLAADSALWPEKTQENICPELVGLPLPEFFATADPWEPPAGRLHCRNSAVPGRGTAAERIFCGRRSGAQVLLERLPGAAGTAGQRDGFRVSGADVCASGRSVPAAVMAFAALHPGYVSDFADEGQPSAFLYSVEDFLQECRFGPVRIACDGVRFSVEADHPASGSIRSDDNMLAGALVLARRQLLASPGFRLHGVPPYGMRHAGNASPDQEAENAA